MELNRTVRSRSLTSLAKGLLFAPAMAFMLAVPANATLIVTYGVDNSLTDNVIYGACDSSVQSNNAQTIQGCLNTDHFLGIDVMEDSEAISFDNGIGQAQVNSLDSDGFDHIR